MARRASFDAVIVGGGHNGLVAAILLARAGRSVAVLERRVQVGGAAVSGRPFAGVGASLSRYAYLVSLFPATLMQLLGLPLELRPRAIASYTPNGDSGLLVDGAGQIEGAHAGDREAWGRFHGMLGRVAQRLFPTLTEPLRSRNDIRRLIDDETAWRMLFEEPLSVALEKTFSSDLVRGVVLTDATIGTFAPADDPILRQNRCFLYHVIGNGTGRWDVPVGGMGALAGALLDGALTAGAEVRTSAEVVAIATDGARAEVRCADGAAVHGRHVLANVAPAVLSLLLGEAPPAEAPEGSQLKVNMLLERLPRLRDPRVDPSDAFTGTFHVNEGYDQLDRAYREAAAGRVPSLVPCEAQCHSLTDATILDPELRDAGAHTLTVFALHTPARLFTDPGAKDAALAAVMRSLDSVLAEPIEHLLWRAPDGTSCLETVTPVELEAQLAMPGGHIFHRDLAWPFAESDEDAGRWGVETARRNVWLCGSGARRGGAVSGIPGYNAARAVLEAEKSRRRRRS
jgi:phytoene dehydrogenase-like protein